ncbi:MAG: thermonuclease family protein [Bacilli bacterium]
MKKICLLICLFIPTIIFGLDTKEVDFSKCIDGDTAKFIMDKEEITVRFIAIDTPETKHPKKGEEPFGKKTSNYTCNMITNATKIKLEFDEKSYKKDKYDRYIAWIFVDDALLQKRLIQQGYAKVDYIYGDYKYLTELNAAQTKAQLEKKGIWSDVNPYKEIIYAIGIAILGAMGLLITKNGKKKLNTKKLLKKIT